MQSLGLAALGQQSQRLGSLLWDGIGLSGVPSIPGFYSFVCMRLPHPAEIDPELRVKEHVRSAIGASMGSSGLDDVLEELRLSAGEINWSMEEAFELIGQFRAWWDENKHRLHLDMPLPFGSPAAATKRTTWRIVSALSTIVAQQPIGQNDEGERALRDFVSDLTAQGMPTIRLEVATFSKSSDGRGQSIDRIAAGMLDSERDDVLDALIAARLLAIAVTEQESQGGFAQVGTMLVRGVEWRHRPALLDRLRVVAGMVREFPWFLSSERETSLLRGLAYLVDESATPIKGNDSDGVILIRAAAASLAFELFRHYRKLETDVPETIRRWETICCDSNEFAEVKNAWMRVAV